MELYFEYHWLKLPKHVGFFFPFISLLGLNKDILVKSLSTNTGKLRPQKKNVSGLFLLMNLMIIQKLEFNRLQKDIFDQFTVILNN